MLVERVLSTTVTKFIEQHEPLLSTSCARQQERTVLWLLDDDASSDAASDVTSVDGSRRGRTKNKDKLAAKPIRDDEIQCSRNRIRPTRDDSTDSARRSNDKDHGGKRCDRDKDTADDKYVKQTVSKLGNTTSTRHTSARGDNGELSDDGDITGDDKAGRPSKYYAWNDDEPNRRHGRLSPPQRGRSEPCQSFAPSGGREQKRSSSGDRRHTSSEHRNRRDKRETGGRSERSNGEKRNSDTRGRQRPPSNGDGEVVITAGVMKMVEIEIQSDAADSNMIRVENAAITRHTRTVRRQKHGVRFIALISVEQSIESFKIQ